MTANRRNLIVTAAAIALTAAVIPASVSAAAERFDAPQLSYDLASFSPDSAKSASAPIQVAQQASVDREELDCMAKVVHHESRGQPRRGMIAVAQTLLNRMKAGGRFGKSICEVANQPGQYFKTASYRPRADDSWQEAVEVSRDTITGTAEDAARGALFFHAGFAKPNTFFRSRERVGAIGGQVFYR